MIEREKKFWKGKRKNNRDRCRWKEKGKGSAVLSNPGFAKIRIGENRAERRQTYSIGGITSRVNQLSYR